MDEIQMRQGHWAVVDLVGKGGAYSHCARSVLGQSRCRRLDTRCERHRGQSLPSGRPQGQGVGPWHLAECRLVRSEDMLRESGLSAHCTTRPPRLCRIPDYAEFHRSESVGQGGARKRFGIIGVLDKS
jgi:hypothetical protein